MENQPHSIIVGGTKGLGRSLAERFAGTGHRVSVLGRHEPADGWRAPGISHMQVDLSDGAGLRTALDGLSTRGPVCNLIFAQRFRGKDEPWQREIEISLTATRIIIELLTDHFAAAASIVIVSSVVGTLVADDQPAGYHVAKAGLDHLARYFAVKLGPRGVRCNCVSPSIFIKTESREYHTDPERAAFYRKVIPLGRAGTMEDICGVIAFLCSSEAAYLTGQNLIVDGGLTLQSPMSVARKIAGG